MGKKCLHQDTVGQLLHPAELIFRRLHTGTTCQSVVAFLSLQTEGVQRKRQTVSLDQKKFFEMNQILFVLFYGDCTAKAKQLLHLNWLYDSLTGILYQGHAQSMHQAPVNLVLNTHRNFLQTVASSISLRTISAVLTKCIASL